MCCLRKVKHQNHLLFSVSSWNFTELSLMKIISKKNTQFHGSRSRLEIRIESLFLKNRIFILRNESKIPFDFFLLQASAMACVWISSSLFNEFCNLPFSEFRWFPFELYQMSPQIPADLCSPEHWGCLQTPLLSSTHYGANSQVFNSVGIVPKFTLMGASRAVWDYREWTLCFSEVHQLCLFPWYLIIPFPPKHTLAFICTKLQIISMADVAIAAAMAVFAAEQELHSCQAGRPAIQIWFIQVIPAMCFMCWTEGSEQQMLEFVSLSKLWQHPRSYLKCISCHCWREGKKIEERKNSTEGSCHTKVCGMNPGT